MRVMLKTAFMAGSSKHGKDFRASAACIWVVATTLPTGRGVSLVWVGFSVCLLLGQIQSSGITPGTAWGFAWDAGGPTGVSTRQDQPAPLDYRSRSQRTWSACIQQGDAFVPSRTGSLKGPMRTCWESGEPSEPVRGSQPQFPQCLPSTLTSDAGKGTWPSLVLLWVHGGGQSRAPEGSTVGRACPCPGLTAPAPCMISQPPQDRAEHRARTKFCTALGVAPQNKTKTVPGGSGA